MNAPQAYVAKSGAWVSFDKGGSDGMYIVKLYSASGNLIDKVRCDDYRNACAYKRSFIAIAKNQ